MRKHYYFASVVLLLALVYSTLVYAIDIKLGSSIIVLPSPAGYVEVTDILPEEREIADRLIDAKSQLLAEYLNEDDVGKALKKQRPDYARYIVVFTLKKDMEKTGLSGFPKALSG